MFQKTVLTLIDPIEKNQPIFGTGRKGAAMSRATNSTDK